MAVARQEKKRRAGACAGLARAPRYSEPSGETGATEAAREGSKESTRTPGAEGRER